jgi:hypothetical protein
LDYHDAAPEAIGQGGHNRQNPGRKRKRRPAKRDTPGTKVTSFRTTKSEERKMNETELAMAIERLMARVDYYLHCELDEEYDHDRPDTARHLLEAALRQELLRASAVSIVSAVSAAGSPSLNNEN